MAEFAVAVNPPSWFATVETVTLQDIHGATASFAPGDAELFTFGISFPDSNLGIHSFLPWAEVHSLSASLA